MKFRKFRVHFIGSGYESIKFVIVMASSPMTAMMTARARYEDYGWDFDYCEMEAEEYN